MSKPKEDLLINIPKDLIEELLTESEKRMVKKRLLVLKLLVDGLSVREIAKRVQVGTDTVVRMSKKLESSEILKLRFNKKSSAESTQSKWVFGKKE